MEERPRRCEIHATQQPNQKLDLTVGLRPTAAQFQVGLAERRTSVTDKGHATELVVGLASKRDIVVRLPHDFPAGTAEVIILSEANARPPVRAQSSEPPRVARAELLQALAHRFPSTPDLGPVIFNEAPGTPLDEDDWPAELRP
jgi:hypothetical protein